MKKLKSYCKKLFRLPVWLLIILTILSAAMLVFIFVTERENCPLAYVAYTLSAYTFASDCVFLSVFIPKLYKRVREKLYTYPFFIRHINDKVFKVRVSLFVSLTINIVYSVVKLFSSFFYSSLWLGADAVYYILLSVLCFVLLRYMRNNEVKSELLSEYRRCRLCGVLMLIFNLCLTVTIFQIICRNKPFSYKGNLIFAVAAYTFYTVTVSVIDIVKYRRFKSPILSAAKAIRLAVALVSLLSLESAMLVQFGDDEELRIIMTACTGAAVCITVLAMSVIMIVRSSKEIRKIQKSDIRLRKE